MKKLKNENELRKLYFLTRMTTQINHRLPFNPRFINQIYANINAYFWLDCHKCGQNFGGHEWYGSDNCTGICPSCVLKHYNETGEFDQNNKNLY